MKMLTAVVVAVLFFGAIEDQWKVTLPFEVKKDLEQFAPSVKFNRKSATLRNRGSMATKEDYAEGATFRATWRWTKGKEEGKYHDHLIVAFFSSGNHRQKRSYEVVDGLSFRFNPGAGGVAVEHFEADKDPVFVAKKTGLIFERDKDYQITVEATKKHFIVSIDGNAVLKGNTPEGLIGKKIVVYNREPNAGVEMESILTDPVVIASAV